MNRRAPLVVTIILALAVSALALLTTAPVSAGPPAAPVTSAGAARGGTLVVRVTTSARGALGPVKVTGPKGYARVVRRTVTLRGLVPGRYLVKAAKVVIRRTTPKRLAGTYYPLSARQPVRVRAGKRATVRVRFDVTRLRLAIGNTVPGQVATGTLTGPGGSTRAIRSNGALAYRNIAPGNYRLTLDPFTSNDPARPGEYRSPFPGTVTVRPGRSGRLVSSYDIVVSEDLRSAPQSDVAQVETSATPGATGTVTLADGYAADDIVAVPVTPEAPEGALVRLLQVVSSASGLVTWSVENVDLTEAVPYADFTSQATVPVRLQDGTGARSSPPGRTSSNPFTKAVSCGAGARLDIEAGIEGGISTSMKLDWESTYREVLGVNVWSGSTPHLKLDATAGLSAFARAALSGQASCELARTDLLPHPVRLGVIPVPGVPGLVLTPELQFTIEGEAEGKATFATGVDASIRTSVGLDATLSSFTTSYDAPRPQFNYQPPSLTSEASASLRLGARVTFKINGIAGPYVTASVGPELAANPDEDPWWTLDARLKAGVGLRADVLGFEFDASKDDLIWKKWRLADSGGGYDGVDGGDDPDTQPALRTIATYGVRADLRCTLYTNEDEFSEFFGDDGVFTSEGDAWDEDNGDACATLAVVDGELFGPSDIDAYDMGATPWETVSQSVTGSNTRTDPTTVRTVVLAPGTSVRLEQVDTWWAGGDSIRTSVRVRTGGTSHDVRVTRGFDCYIGDSDTGYGEMVPSAQLVGCLRSLYPEDGPSVEVALRLQGLTPGATWVEGGYADVWREVEYGDDLSNTCTCYEDLDNGVAVSWWGRLATNDSDVYSSEISMRRAD